MKIVIVDDNKEFRKGLKLFLEGHLGYEVVGEFENGKAFLNQKSIRADIVLMDINMPEVDGLKATKLSLNEQRDTKIIALSQYKENVDLELLIGVGFRGFVSKVNVFQDLETAIKFVSEGRYYYPNEIKLRNNGN